MRDDDFMTKQEVVCDVKYRGGLKNKRGPAERVGRASKDSCGRGRAPASRL